MKNSITGHLDQIEALFTVPVTITIIIRSDAMAEDMIITNDDLDQVAGAIMRHGGESLQ